MSTRCGGNSSTFFFFDQRVRLWHFAAISLQHAWEVNMARSTLRLFLPALSTALLVAAGCDVGVKGIGYIAPGGDGGGSGDGGVATGDSLPCDVAVILKDNC